MKKLTLLILRLYKAFMSPLLHQLVGAPHACRYLPTCSEYATIHIEKDGIIRGSVKSLGRLLCCQPFISKLPQALQN